MIKKFEQFSNNYLKLIEKQNINYKPTINCSQKNDIVMLLLQFPECRKPID